MTEPDNAHDAAVERVAQALANKFADAPHFAWTEAAAVAIAAYKQGQVTDEKLWAEYKRGREQDVAAYEATVDRRSVYGATAK